MYHKLYIAGIVTVLCGQSWGNVTGDGSKFAAHFRWRMVFKFQYFNNHNAELKTYGFWAAYHCENQTGNSGDAPYLDLTTFAILCTVCAGCVDYVGKMSPKQHLIIYSVIKGTKSGSLPLIKPKYSPDATHYWPKSTCSISGYMTHPHDGSRSVFKSPRATPVLPCSCVEGTLPVALTCSPNLRLY